MMKNIKVLRRLGIGALISMALVIPANGVSYANVTDEQSLDGYVRDLKYNDTTNLTSNGESISNPGVTEGKLNGDTFTVVERTKKSARNRSADISVLNANASEIYPGAAILANQNLIDNRPTLLGVSRAPATISVDLPGLTGESNREVVSNLNKASANGAVNTLLERWNAGVAKDYPNTTARMDYEDAMAYSESQLKAKFGAGFSDALRKLNVNFEAVSQGKSQARIASFKQIFYTASFDTPTTPSAMFAEGTTATMLQNAGVNDTSPPAYVSSVSYGRQIYVKLETSSTSDKVSAAFDAAVKSEKVTAEVKADAEVQQILQNSSYQVLIFGGAANSQARLLVAS